MFWEHPKQTLAGVGLASYIYTENVAEYTNNHSQIYTFADLLFADYKNN